MRTHTKEPWEAVTDCPGECCWHLQYVGNDNPMDRVNSPEMSEADARRIAACVNACAGISNHALEAWVTPPSNGTGAPDGTWAQHLLSLSGQRDALLTALDIAEEFMSGFEDDDAQDGMAEKLKTIRDALTLARSA